MTRVGVKELEARLSEYLERVQAGEQIVVTLRGREVAQISPIAQSSGVAALCQLARLEGTRWRPGGWAYPPPYTRIRGNTMAETILEDRGDPLP